MAEPLYLQENRCTFLSLSLTFRLSSHPSRVMGVLLYKIIDVSNLGLQVAKPLYLGGPASRRGSWNSLFQVALHLPSCRWQNRSTCSRKPHWHSQSLANSPTKLEKGIRTPMAQGRSPEIISTIKRIRASRLSIKNSLSGLAGGRAALPARESCGGTLLETFLLKRLKLFPLRSEGARLRGWKGMGWQVALYPPSYR